MFEGIKKTLQAYADFEKAMLQIKMVTGDSMTKLKSMSKENLIEKIVNDTRATKLLEEHVNFLCNKSNETNLELNGFKTLAEKQKRTIAYYKEQLATVQEAKINLMVSMDMGLQT